MKRKHKLGKGISLLLVLSLLLGVSVVGALAEDSSVGDAVAQAETTAFPWDGYTRITMADYKKADGTSIEAPTEEAGKTYTSSLSGTYTGTSLHKTYLDVDINCDGNYDGKDSNGGYYFHFFGSGNWDKNIRIRSNGTHFIIKDAADPKRDTVQTGDIWQTHQSMEASLTEFFNLKILTDIVTNAGDVTKNDVRLQFFINGNKAGEMAWTEDASENHNNFYFYCPSGSFSLRTPEAWEDYTRITMADYKKADGTSIEAPTEEAGKTYTSSLSGTYTGTSLHKTYLDVDINCDGNYDGKDSNGGYYFHFFGSGNWDKNIRIRSNGTHFIIKDAADPKRDTVQTGDIWQTHQSMEASLTEFFNLKILTDIVTNAGDATKNDVRLQFFINGNKAGEMAWTEDASENHNNFYFYCPNGAFSLRTPLLPEDIDYGYDISAYRTSVNTDGEYTSYPTKTGYVFGGWYSDAYLTEPLDFSVTTGKAYAKFVQEDVLTVKFQKLVNASKEDTTTSLRAVTSVDSLDYEYVGFKRLVEGDTQEKVYKTKSVYRTIKGTVNGETYTYTPSNISDAAEYLMALSINKIPQSVYEKEITITPLWKTLDGTVVTGTARTIQLFPEDVEGGTTLYGGEDFANDNEAYYKNIWI